MSNKESWEEEFDKWRFDFGMTGGMYIGDDTIVVKHKEYIKNFISQLLAKAKEEGRQEGLKNKRPYGYWKTIEQQATSLERERIFDFLEDHYWDSLDKNTVMLHLKVIKSKLQEKSLT